MLEMLETLTMTISKCCVFGYTVVSAKWYKIGLSADFVTCLALLRPLGQLRYYFHSVWRPITWPRFVT